MRDDYSKQTSGNFEPFPVLQSKGADGQQRIEAAPDAEWEWKKPGKPPILEKAGHLLVSMGHGLSTARLTAVASDERYVGQGWMPVTGLDAAQAKAAAVFLNSTPGRLLILRCPGKKLRFPFYNPAVWRDLPIPDLEDDHIRETLAACWEATRYTVVPQFRDGECEVRQSWDAGVCDALGWDHAEITGLRMLLHEEPHVKGLGYGQYADEPDGADEQDTTTAPKHRDTQPDPANRRQPHRPDAHRTPHRPPRGLPGIRNPAVAKTLAAPTAGRP